MEKKEFGGKEEKENRLKGPTISETEGQAYYSLCNNFEIPLTLL